MQSDSTNPDSVADAFLASTLRYIQFQKQQGGVVGEKFDSVKLSWSLAAFVGKASLKVMVFSGICGKSAAKGLGL
ncbi:hypothetical protein Gotur_024081 [Gossypium turneri]